MLRHLRAKHWSIWILILVAIFFALVFLTAVPYLIFSKKYEQKIFPGIRIGQTELGGMTKEQARSAIGQKVNSINDNGVGFILDGEKKIIYPIYDGLNSDLVLPVITFDPDQTVEQIFGYGRTGNSLRQIKEEMRAWIFGQDMNMLFSIDSEQLKKALSQAYAKKEKPAQNAAILLENGEISITEEKKGTRIDYADAMAKMEQNISRINTEDIHISSTTDEPIILKTDLIGLENEIRKMLDLAPITIVYPEKDKDGKQIPKKNKKWTVQKNILAQWISTKDPDRYSHISFQPEKIKAFLEGTIAPDISVKMNEARFRISGGKVVEFQASRNGLEIDASSTIDLFIEDILNSNKRETALVLIETKSSISQADVNDLGITEIIGSGQSNFSGSPANRRHNIKTGANAVNGLLIKPGEEFSLIKALGKIDGSTGYLPELVIKENKTIPEYGGGLCQIGTTVFRAALGSGLPITQRRNHSYRVSYYEPAGTDATIYDPQPDLRFLNDTSDYILIQSRIAGSMLYFDFWGTKDGRKVYKTYPTIYNIKKPEPTKLIETLDLPAGKKKCTERAHNGADAYFDYQVTYSDGEVKSKRFSSHYIPWREVCLIGVAKLSTDASAKTDTSPSGQKAADPEPDASPVTADPPVQVPALDGATRPDDGSIEPAVPDETGTSTPAQ